NGRTVASQATHEGSIPFTRFYFRWRISHKGHNGHKVFRNFVVVVLRDRCASAGTYFPPKNFLKDWKSLFGMSPAFFPKSFSFCANCICSPPWISQPAEGTLSAGRSSS